jgi:hypothetical protein
MTLHVGQLKQILGTYPDDYILSPEMEAAAKALTGQASRPTPKTVNAMHQRVTSGVSEKQVTEKPKPQPPRPRPLPSASSKPTPKTVVAFQQRKQSA